MVWLQMLFSHSQILLKWLLEMEYLVLSSLADQLTIQMLLSAANKLNIAMVFTKRRFSVTKYGLGL